MNKRKVFLILSGVMLGMAFLYPIFYRISHIDNREVRFISALVLAVILGIIAILFYIKPSFSFTDCTNNSTKDNSECKKDSKANPRI